MFNDRKDAGRQLAEELTAFREDYPVIVAVPRGGVIVGAEIAAALNAPLDVVIARKVGSPYNPEVAIGAVTPDGEVMLDRRLMAALRLQPEDLEGEISSAREELARRMETYRRGRVPFSWESRTLILVDDGIATGFTLKATIDYIRRQKPCRIVLAVPVAPSDVAAEMEEMVDNFVCLIRADNFYAVGQFYRDFSQTSDKEVLSALAQGLPER